jgi:filamentous hemagglutinin
LKLADIANRVVIDPRKLTHYVLDPSSPHGKHKAVLFKKLLGFTQENYTDLVHQLETKSLQAEATFHSKDEFGKRYTVDVLVEGMEGQQATIRTGWLVPAGTNEAHLVTLYVKRE